MFGNETVKKIAGNTIYQIVGKFFSMSVTILVTIIVTRMYGIEGYGAFNLMQSFPALFFVIADFGFNAIASRELTKNWDNAQAYFQNILLFRIAGSFLIIALAGISLIFLPYDSWLKMGIFLSLFLILTQALYATTNIIFQVKLRYDLSNISYIIGSVVILVLVAVLSYLKVSIIWIAFSYVVGGVVIFILNAVFISKFGIISKLRFDRSISKPLFLGALPLGLMFIFSQVNFKADTLLMSVLPVPSWLFLSNTESIAIYGLPYKVFEVALVVPTFFMNSVYPVMVKKMTLGKEELKATFLKTIAFLSGVGVVVGLVGYFFAPIIIDVIGGGGFERSVTVLRILLSGLIIFYATQPISWLIVTLGGQKYLPGVYLVSAVFNVAANLILIPRYSFYGSSVVTIVSELIILILLVFYARKVWEQTYA